MPLASAAPRNCVIEDGFCLRPVDDFALFTGFSCGNADLDEFLHEDAALHAAELMARTYSLHAYDAEGLSAPVAFASLLNDSVRVRSGAKKGIPRACHYPTMPAVKIGRLGVRVELHGKHFGTLLLNILKRLFVTDNRTGCRFLVVDAYNDTKTISFYRNNGFRFLQSSDADSDTRLLFYDLKRVVL